MCCRYYYSDYREVDGDERLNAIRHMMEHQYPGQYKTGEIFPGDPAPSVIDRKGKLVAVPATFGMPGYQNDKLLLNARSETAAEKKTFAESLRERRIILPATGFYEWDASKTKYLFTWEMQPVFYLCGLYKLIDGICRFVILTRTANESMREVHDRMPVIVSAREVRPYLTDLDAAMAILSAAAPLLSRRKA